MGDLFPTLTPLLARVPLALWRGTRCVGRGLKKVGRALLYVLPVLVLVHLIATFVTGRMVGKEIERLRADGLIVSADELIPHVPAGERNAADIYQQAFDTLRLSKEDEERLFSVHGEWDPARLPVARAVVSANGEYYRLVGEASQTRHCAFPVSWNSGADMTFPHLGEVRQVARMLDVRAQVFAADGEYDEAVESPATVLRILEHVRLEPTIIAALVSTAQQRMVATSLENLLSRGSPSPEACRRLFDRIGAVDIEEHSVRAFRGETVLLGIRTFDQLRRSEVTIGELRESLDPGSRRRHAWGLRLAQIGRRPLLNLDEIAYLRHMEGQFKALQCPWPESEKMSEELQVKLERLPRSYALSNLLTPVLGRFIWSRKWGAAQLFAAQVALAAVAHEGEHGSLPASLAELEAAGWDLPADPFGGGEYRYRREGRGFVVWSIGPDMDDDEAARDYHAWRELPDDEREEYDYDVIFRCVK